MERLNFPLFRHEVSQHRREDCKNYASCLRQAAIKGWLSFSCKNCENYKQAKTDYIKDIPNVTPSSPEESQSLPDYLTS